MTGDPQYSNIPVITSFLKAFGRAFLGPQPAKNGDATPEEASLPDGVEELVPPEVQKKMRELFVNYFETTSKTLVKGQIVGWRLCYCTNLPETP